MSGPRCTYCQGTEFLEGPSGGISTNILCANKECRHWFNWTPMTGTLDDINRVEPTDEEKKQSANRLVMRAQEAFARRLAEGRKAYRDGLPIGPCAGSTQAPLIEPEEGAGLRSAKAYGTYAEPFANIDRLAGYLEAMREDIIQLKKHVGMEVE